MATRLGAIVNELVEVQDSNDENEESINVVHKFIEATIEVGETTKITQKEMQPWMVGHNNSCLWSSFQLGLENLLVFVPKDRKKPLLEDGPKDFSRERN